MTMEKDFNCKDFHYGDLVTLVDDHSLYIVTNVLSDGRVCLMRIVDNQMLQPCDKNDVIMKIKISERESLIGLINEWLYAHRVYDMECNNNFYVGNSAIVGEFVLKKKTGQPDNAEEKILNKCGFAQSDDLKDHWLYCPTNVKNAKIYVYKTTRGKWKWFINNLDTGLTVNSCGDEESQLAECIADAFSYGLREFISSMSIASIVVVPENK